MNRMVAVALLAVTAWVGGADRASANILYTFSGVVFDDGGTLTGTFETDDLLTTLLDFDITTSINGDLGFHYTPATTTTSSTSLPNILVFGSDSSTEPILQVTFDGGLTATGATIKIGQFDSFEQSAGPTARREIVAGEAIIATAPIPEPSSVVLAGIACIGLATIAARRRGRS